MEKTPATQESMLQKRLEKGSTFYRRPLMTINDHEKAEFEEACQSVLDEFIMPLLTSRNPLYYHKCCLSFSAKKFKGAKTYPKDQTVDVIKTTWKDRLKNGKAFTEFMMNEQTYYLLGLANKPLVNVNHHELEESKKIYEKEIDLEMSQHEIRQLNEKLQEKTDSELKLMQKVAFWF